MKVSVNLKIAAIQMTSVEDWDRNIDWCQSEIEAHTAHPPDIFCFPENALYMRLHRSNKVLAKDPDDPKFDRFEKLARQLNSYIYFGSLPLTINGKIFNSSLIFTPEGKRLTPYQKIHLFDIQLKDHDPIRESDDFQAGQNPAIIDVKGWKWGLSICYDLRFAELFFKYAQAQVDVISVPSAFLVPTGQAHWHTLLRARAIESQAYVIAPAQSGSHLGLRETYGHSLVIDPWGAVLLELKQNGTQVIEIAKSEIQRVRDQIPMSQHRRLD